MPSIREIAKEIAAPTIGKVAPAVYREIVAAIEQALRNERERCAKIVNSARSEGADLRELVARIRDENYEVEP